MIICLLQENIFGEANYYIVYKIVNGNCIYDCTIKNITFKEGKEGNPNKAKHIKNLLKE